ncbi:MAG: glycerol-3-phosphate dehydrogenase/oxidase [Balneolaceae bacterium]
MNNLEIEPFLPMNRTALLEEIQSDLQPWDVIVIGGGATGLGCALDSVTRGYRTLLLEQHDFAKGTSSRSTKLVHGGVRYLKQGEISLVREALEERGRMRKNAPHLVHSRAFIIPGYRWWEKLFYGIGLTIYDLMAGTWRLGRSRILSRKETLNALQTLEPFRLKGGVRYLDGQFDDARLAIDLMKTIHDHGGVALNYMRVTGLQKNENGKINGVHATDVESGDVMTLKTRSVVNATGVFTDEIRKQVNTEKPDVIQASQGVHIVLDRSFFPGESALMIPKTEDGRVLFAVPWHNRVLIGTTDTPIDRPVLEPVPLQQELDFLLAHTARYLTRDPKPEDVRSIFTGLRPLVNRNPDESTKSLSRDHTILTDESGLVTITGGKWTTYRRMAEETIDHVIDTAGLEPRTCKTHELSIHGSTSMEGADPEDPAELYGSDKVSIDALERDHPEWAMPLHPDLPYKRSHVIWAVRHEMARTVEDVLARRTRSLFLDSRASRAVAADVAGWIATELGRDEAWMDQQLTDFDALLTAYEWPDTNGTKHS